MIVGTLIVAGHYHHDANKCTRGLFTTSRRFIQSPNEAFSTYRYATRLSRWVSKMIIAEHNSRNIVHIVHVMWLRIYAHIHSHRLNVCPGCCCRCVVLRQQVRLINCTLFCSPSINFGTVSSQNERKLNEVIHLSNRHISSRYSQNMPVL